jgi:hypothetical protein
VADFATQYVHELVAQTQVLRLPKQYHLFHGLVEAHLEVSHCSYYHRSISLYLIFVNYQKLFAVLERLQHLHILLHHYLYLLLQRQQRGLSFPLVLLSYPVPITAPPPPLSLSAFPMLLVLLFS